MFRKEVEIRGAVSNRNAQEMVQHCMRYHSEIMVEEATRRVNAKSIMGVVSLALKPGNHIVVSANGDDEVEAVNDIALLLESNFHS